MRTRVWVGATVLAALAFAGQPARAAALTEDTFKVETTGDLVALCSATQTDPMYTAAQNFCHGFAVGTYRLVVEVVTAEAESKNKKKFNLFCAPNPAPTRNEAVAAFVAWAGTHADVAPLPPTVGLLKFMADKYPCSK